MRHREMIDTGQQQAASTSAARIRASQNSGMQATTRILDSAEVTENDGNIMASAIID